MSQRVFIDARFALRQDLQPRTWLHHEVDRISYVARINDSGDWAAYQGDPGWAPTRIATSGYRLSEKSARELFPVCADLPYKTTLKLIPFKSRQRTSVRAVLNRFEETLLEAGFAEIEDLKIQRLRAGMALSEAVELLQNIKNDSVLEIPQNLNLLNKQLERAMQLLRPLREESTSLDSTEVAL